MTQEDFLTSLDDGYSFPLWVPFYPDKVNADGLLESIHYPESQHLGQAVTLVFTDSDAALRYVDEIDSHDIGVLVRETPAEMILQLEHAKGKGVRYVGFDLWIQNNSVEYVEIERFIEWIKSAKRAHPESPH